MKVLGYILAGLVGLGIGYYAGKSKSSMGSPELSGLGVGGSPRRGRPKTEAERLETHRRLYGESTLPPRGTGLKRRGII